ncbi:MAG: double-strand break repair protein AddB [Beijerinckiaceae bacterium]
MSASRANVKTIVPGVPFLRTLVQSCIDGSLGIRFPSDTRDYSKALIYVPTRRAARALAHAFAEALQPRAVLLPRIIPLGDPSDLEENAILAGDNLPVDATILPAIGDLERRLMLTQLIEGWRRSGAMRALERAGDGFSIGGSFTDSFALASDLAGLIDEFAVEGIAWRKLTDLAQGQFDEYWAMTRSFLEIAGQAWPAIIAERGLLDPSERLNRLLRNEAERLQSQPPDHPVIAAGSTGTVPATAALLAVIARLPQGAVVLPGLDTTTDARGWTLIAASPRHGDAQPGHPQAALKHLLLNLQIERSDVESLGAEPPFHAGPSALQARSAIVRASARAAEATDDWPQMRRALADHLSAGLESVRVIEASDEREEALAIAIALREVLETPGQTGALITPDRALAQRVATELKRWGINADDSSGVSLAMTPLGGFARLLHACVLSAFSPRSVMALLSHPCLALDTGETPRHDALAAFEIAALRSNDLGAGLQGLAAALDDAEARIAKPHAPPPLRRLSDGALAGARVLLACFVEAMAPYDAIQASPQRLSVFAHAQTAALERLAGERASTGGDAVALGRAFDGIATNASDPVITSTDYVAVFDMVLAETVVPPPHPVQGRIKIWGLLEARLMETDRVVLGGLNEGVWPPEARIDPFLNRSMRSALGLSAPERRIGQSAHDFAQALGASEVIIAHARTVEGTPMVASRFLRRLDAFIGEAPAKALRHRGQSLLEAARAIDHIPAEPLIRRPEPCPPASMQPTSLSLTEIGQLYRDPYAIYARHILDLAPLDPLEQSVDARDRGSIIHEALARFVEESWIVWPTDPLARLITIGRESFAKVQHLEQVGAFWWPVFERVAVWFVAWETERRPMLAHSNVERAGSMPLALADGTLFKLRGRADRIDLCKDGGLAIVDYKSGSAPTSPQVQENFEPQLTLTAAIAQSGGFETIPAQDVLALSYVLVGADPQEKQIIFAKKPESIEAASARHIDSLKTMLNRLRSGEEAFISRRMPEKVRDGGDYDHLARVKEWLDDTGE